MSAAPHVVELEPGLSGLYLIHLTPGYRHAGHYLGYSADVEARLAEHRAGGSKASPLLRAAAAAGAELELPAEPPHERACACENKNETCWCPLAKATCRAAGVYHR